MKIFAIKDKDSNHKEVAYLFYYEKKKKFYIEISEDVDEWESPFILSSFVKKGQRTVDAKWSKIWVQQRIVPPDRQNITQILKENRLDAYDEFKLLVLADGRCAQDELYIEPRDIDDLPADIKKRQKYIVQDIVPLSNHRAMVTFADGKVKVCDIDEMAENIPSVQRLLKTHPEFFDKMRPEVGGYGIVWDDDNTISYMELYKTGKTMPILSEDLVAYSTKCVVNTAEASEMLGCSRQNIDDLIKRGKLKPIKETEKGKIFLKSDIARRLL